MNTMGLLNSLLGSKQGSSSLGQLASSLLGGQPSNIGGIGALAGSLLGGGASSVKGAMGGGALAMLGSLAFKAYQNSQQSTDQPMDSTTQLMTGERAPETPEEDKIVEDRMMLMLQAMINAAKADGQIDEQEMSKIVGKAKEDGLSDEDQRFMMAEMDKPMNTEALISSASDDPQIAAQIYTASLLAIEIDTDVEKEYLNDLAHRLNLSDNVVSYLQTTVQS
jgi:uncharacterized membrane protein YebE (DUF533 family)